MHRHHVVEAEQPGQGVGAEVVSVGVDEVQLGLRLAPAAAQVGHRLALVDGLEHRVVRNHAVAQRQRFGAVMPLLVVRVRMTLAFLRKSFICSTVSCGAGAGGNGLRVGGNRNERGQ